MFHSQELNSHLLTHIVSLLRTSSTVQMSGAITVSVGSMVES